MSKVPCQRCGKEMDWPPLDYAADAPWRQMGVKDEEFAERVLLGRDDCVVDNQHFMLRGTIDMPVLGTTDTFSWGVWCSVTEPNYRRISEIWEHADRADEPSFAALLLSALPAYSVSTVNVKSRLQLRVPGLANLIQVDPEHRLGQEQADGISIDRVHEFAKTIIGPDAKPHCPHCRNAG